MSLSTRYFESSCITHERKLGIEQMGIKMQVELSQFPNITGMDAFDSYKVFIVDNHVDVDGISLASVHLQTKPRQNQPMLLPALLSTHLYIAQRCFRAFYSMLLLPRPSSSLSKT